MATVNDVTHALQDPNAYGIIFLGHPAIKTQGSFPNKKIIHGYLQDAQGKYLPKEILSGAHKNLRFLSIMTCHESAVIPLYINSLPQSVHYYKSPTHGLNSLDNPLFEFTSFYSTPKIVDEINADLEQSRFKLENHYVMDSFYEDSKTLVFKVKDLVSQRFGYSVFINGRYLGAMFAQKNARGRLLNKVTFKFNVPPYLWSSTENTIRVAPDDRNRPRSSGLQVVDDILLTQVKLDDENLLDGPFHIGDQRVSPDLNEGLGFIRNREEFSLAPFIFEWEVKL